MSKTVQEEQGTQQSVKRRKEAEKQTRIVVIEILVLL